MSESKEAVVSLTTLCLQAGSRRIPIQIDAQTATAHDLYQRAAMEVAAVLNNNNKNIQLRAGVPPRLLDDDATKTLQACGIRHQDRILVVVAATTAPAAPAAATTSTTSGGQRPKRKAAQAATAAFPEVIAQQEAAVAAAAERSSRRSSSPQKKKNKTTKTAASHFAKLERQGSGAAFRLRDGQQVAPPPPRHHKNKRRAKSGSGTQLEEALVESTTGALQGRWKAAVASAYEHNLAAAREAALTADCVFEVVVEDDDSSSPAGTTTPQQLTVTFPKGVQGRGTFTDTVPLLPRDAMATALRTVAANVVEDLRHMPLFSPRVYWSLRYHYRDCRTVPDCVEAAVPEIDCRPLRHRHRALSAKARENERQKQEAAMDAAGADAGTDWEAAVEAMEAVENALGFGVSAARVLEGAESSSWRVVTPDEEDLDELKECIGQTIDAGDSQETNRQVQLLLEHGIRNWRQLANRAEEGTDIPTEWIDYAQAQSVEEIMIEICEDDSEAVAVLRDDAHSGTPRDLKLWRRVVGTLQEEVPAYSVEQLQRWCDRAAAATDQLPWLLDFRTPHAT